MPFKKEAQTVAVGEVEGGANDLILTLQITAEKTPLSARERAAAAKGAREALYALPGIKPGYHSKNVTAKAKAQQAKNAEPKPAKKGKKSDKQVEA